ncbi:PE family protein [Mycobacterium asiaticum]|uniref:PE domain-containing protein n=1 Tax=Mycobacterium asiaticum TaxID=1790 RepID=A0A1A3CF37_MYCAS|nr:PE family protein [Mycobacterium asiaticum]OBI85288.1 hypothetical protein A9X01_18110 [Mycobacterium asiaticum]
MSFVFVEPQIMAAFAANLSNIGSALTAANATAAASTTGVLAAAADEVSQGIAALFSENAAGYQQISAQVAASYERFVQAVTSGANAYAAAELGTAQALVNGLAAPTLSLEGFAELYGGFTANLVNAELSFNQALVGGEVALRQAIFGSGNALSAAVDSGLNVANSFIEAGQTAINTLLGAQVPANFASSLAVDSSLDANLGLGGLTGSFNAALNGFGAQLNAALSGNLSAALPDLAVLVQAGNSLGANINAGLNSLVQTGGALANNFISNINALTQTGGSLSAIFGGDLSSLGAQLNGALNAALSGNLNLGLPDLPALGATLVADFNSAVAGFGINLPALNASLNTALNGLLAGDLDLGLVLPPLPTFESVTANLTAGLNNLATSFNLSLPALAANINGALGPLGAQFNAALTGALSGDTAGLSALVNGLATLPTTGIAGLEQIQSGILANLVVNELAFNASLVANEQALVSALLGPGALLGPVGYAFNAGNLFLGTGEQLLNAVVGAPGVDLTGSLLFNPALTLGGGFTPVGGLTGVVQQLLSLNAALGGAPGLDAALMTQLGLTPAALEALANAQLAFNANLVANEQALQLSIFGTGGALNGALNNAFNGLNLAFVGLPQTVINALIGVPATDVTGSLLVSATGDVFGGVTAGGLLGALEQKFLFDGAVLSNLFTPIQVVLNGDLPGVLANINAVLTGQVTVGGNVEADLGD